LNSEIYKEFHEKILKSYIIDSKMKNNTFAVNVDAAKLVIDNAIHSSFEKKEGNGLEDSFTFENDDGLGTLYLFKNEIIHWSYFKKSEIENNDDILEDELLKTDV